jgi:hypothetical protein
MLDYGEKNVMISPLRRNLKVPLIFNVLANLSEFEVGEVSQNLDDEKKFEEFLRRNLKVPLIFNVLANLSEFEVGEVSQNLDDEKKFEEFLRRIQINSSRGSCSNPHKFENSGEFSRGSSLMALAKKKV